MEIKVINNKKFNAEPSERYLGFWNEVNAGTWEPYSFGYINSFINPQSNVIDIGAWIGPLTLYAANIAKKVWAIEPDKVAYNELLNNIQANPDLINKISTHNICIYNENKDIMLWNENQFGNSGSSVIVKGTGDRSGILVQAQTLQSFIEKNNIEKVDYLKIDIEGAETIVLPDIAGYLIKNHTVLHLSVHPPFFQQPNEINKIMQVIKFAHKIYFDGNEIKPSDMLRLNHFYEVLCVF